LGRFFIEEGEKLLYTKHNKQTVKTA